MGLAGVALEDQARDPRDLAELAAGELGGVQAREDIGPTFAAASSRPSSPIASSTGVADRRPKP